MGCTQREQTCGKCRARGMNERSIQCQCYGAIGAKDEGSSAFTSSRTPSTSALLPETILHDVRPNIRKFRPVYCVSGFFYRYMIEVNEMIDILTNLV